MSITKTIADILTENRVSEEQVLAVTLENGGATVKSAHTEGATYRVEYNREYKRLTCTCKAGQDGKPCQHRRATLAKLAIQRLNARAIVEECIADATIPQTEEEAARSASEGKQEVEYIRVKRYGGLVRKDAQERNHNREFHLMR